MAHFIAHRHQIEGEIEGQGESRPLLDIFADYGRTQIVNFLTREASTLDLIITNKEHSETT